MNNISCYSPLVRLGAIEYKKKRPKAKKLRSFSFDTLNVLSSSQLIETRGLVVEG